MLDIGLALLYDNSMGYNKLILCLNDAENDVDEDPVGWWRRCKEAFWTLSSKKADSKTFSKKPESFGHGSHANGWQAVYEAHADAVALIMVGGNHATVLGTVYNGGMHHDEEDQIRVLKTILEWKGYTIHKKPVVKTTNKA